MINTTLLNDEEVQAYDLVLQIKRNAFEMKKLSEKNQCLPTFNFVTRQLCVAQIKECLEMQTWFYSAIEQRANRIIKLCHTGK